MIIRNANVFFHDQGFQQTSIGMEGDRIVSLSGGSGKEIDASGKYLIPGLIDLHIHGANNADFCDGTYEAMATIGRYEAYQGVTSFLGTCMTTYPDVLRTSFQAASAYMDTPVAQGAIMRGINMEGPFLSKEKKGAQLEECCIPYDDALFMELWEISKHRIKLMDICPEYEGNLDAIEKVSKLTTVSLAHTTADYELSKEAFRRGATHVTHLFNAMPPFHHRKPGLIGAAIEDANQVEMICDGYHLHPAVVKAMFQIFAPQRRICMISDSLRAAGMADGVYELGGQEVHVQNGHATLADGTIAGASICLMEALQTAIGYGLPIHDAITAATYTPARVLGLEKEIGSIQPGYRADCVLLNEDFSVANVILGGEVIR